MRTTLLRKIVYFINISNLKMSTSNGFREKPFIVICGCTGTGKTKLSIQLAKWLNEMTGDGKVKAEIVNADAMQVLHILF